MQVFLGVYPYDVRLEEFAGRTAEGTLKLQQSFLRSTHDMRQRAVPLFGTKKLFVSAFSSSSSLSFFSMPPA